MKRIVYSIIIVHLFLVCALAFAQPGAEISPGTYSFNNIKTMSVTLESFPVSVTQGQTSYVTISLKGDQNIQNFFSYNSELSTSGELFITIMRRVLISSKSLHNSSIMIELAQNMEEVQINASSDLSFTNINKTNISVVNRFGNIRMSNINNERISVSLNSGVTNLSHIQSKVYAIVGTGDISINDSMGAFYLDTTAGSIVLNTIRGVFNTQVASGNVQAHNVFFTNNSRLRVNSGSINAQLSNVSTDVKLILSTESGNLQVGKEQSSHELFHGNGIVTIYAYTGHGNQQFDYMDI